MAKYIVNGGTVNIGPFETREKAAISLIRAVTSALETGSDPTLWHIDTVGEAEAEPEKPKDVPELIPDAEAAREYLNIPHDRCHPIFGDEDVADSLLGVPVETLSQVEAFRDLLLLCKAWNKADGFEVDWEDDCQLKYSPSLWDGEKFTPAGWEHAQLMGGVFAFKTHERAEQFGEKFIGLFKQLYGIREGE